jgi:VWFA-related protein
MKVTRLTVCSAILSVALYAGPPQAQVVQAPANSARPRLVCMFLDLNSMDAASQSKARDNVMQFVEQQVAPSDLVEIVTYTSRVNVIQDFTGDRDSLLDALRTIVPNESGTGFAGNNDSSARVQAIQAAVSSLSRFPERKALVYFSAAAPKLGDDDHSPLKDAFDAARRANVAIYPVDTSVLPTPARQ